MENPITRAQALRPKVLTTSEVALHLRVNPITVQRYCRQGKIPYLLVGGEYRFILSDVIEALKQCPKKTKPTDSDDDKMFT